MSPASLTETLRIDWRPRISFAALLDDAPLALSISRSAPFLVRLGYSTSDRSHNILCGTRQTGHGYVDLAPRIDVARVLGMTAVSGK